MAGLRIALVVLGLLLLLATLLPLIRRGEWWIRIFDFPRLQIAAFLVAVLAASLWVLDASTPPVLLFVAALAAGAAYQASRILPYTPLAPPQVAMDPACDSETCIRLLIANVLMPNRRAGDFLALVRDSDPDLIMTAETDQWWDLQLRALDSRYPFSVKCPLENTYGMHLFSRLELGSPEIRFLIESDVPSIRTAVRLRSGSWIDFYALHPRPPLPRHGTEQRDAELLLVGREVRETGRPTIVAGDLNDVAWSRTTRLFQRISGMLDPRIGRGAYSTFHARYPILRWALDHVFHDRSFTLVGMRRLGYFGSDHFPVAVDLCYRPAAADAQEKPEADREDRKEAAEKIEEGKEAAAGG